MLEFIFTIFCLVFRVGYFCDPIEVSVDICSLADRSFTFLRASQFSERPVIVVLIRRSLFSGTLVYMVYFDCIRIGTRLFGLGLDVFSLFDVVMDLFKLVDGLICNHVARVSHYSVQ